MTLNNAFGSILSRNNYWRKIKYLESGKSVSENNTIFKHCFRKQRIVNVRIICNSSLEEARKTKHASRIANKIFLCVKRIMNRIWIILSTHTQSNDTCAFFYALRARGILLFLIFSLRRTDIFLLHIFF